MNSENSRKRLPPYISYRTFRNFVVRLQQQIPARVDRSYWSDMLSGSTGTQLMAALHFLALIDNNGKPSGRLRALVPAKGEQQAQLLRELTTETYDFVLHGSLDLQNATYGQLEEAFHSTFQLTPDVCRKCIKFFISMATEARMPLSPFMTKRFRSTYTGTGISTIKNVTRKTRHKVIKNGLIPQNLEIVPEEMPWNTMLLTKFPAFDPSWSDEVKLKWFSAFDELLKHNPQRQEQ
jgi:hypothetical protein